MSIRSPWAESNASLLKSDLFKTYYAVVFVVAFLYYKFYRKSDFVGSVIAAVVAPFMLICLAAMTIPALFEILFGEKNK